MHTCIKKILQHRILQPEVSCIKYGQMVHSANVYLHLYVCIELSGSCVNESVHAELA